MNTRTFVRIAALAVASAFLGAAVASDCTRTSTGRIPISDLRTGLYLGQFQGGLYPNGSNQPPRPHTVDGESRAFNIVPRNPAGAPDANGKYVLLSIGMSNTTQEFCGGSPCAGYSFIGQSAASPLVNHAKLAIIDGAAGGQTGDTWDSPTDANYNRVRDTRLTPAGLSEQQVQAVWLKVADSTPTVSLPSASANAYQLLTEMGNICRALKVRYPHLQTVFVSSRIYAGYATSTLNPEPYAYESGFACKWLVEAQIRQMGGGPIDTHAGDLNDRTVAPFITWGPYLWADGLIARGDGLTWACADLQSSDGTHPSDSGRQKVGTMLLNFMLTSPFSSHWFRADGQSPCIADVDDGSGTGTPDGGVTIDDLLFYLSTFEHGSLDADVDDGSGTGTPDGGVTIDDLLYYLFRFAVGC